MLQVLSPKEFGRAIGVSDSSLKRWVDDGRIRAARTAGGHRRIELSEALRFIRENRLPVVDPVPLGLKDLIEVSDDLAEFGPEDSLIYDALISGQGRRVRGAMIAAYINGQSVAELCDGPIAHAMRRVGELWKHDKQGIFVEHRATDMCLGALNLLRGLLPIPDDDVPLALGGAPQGDPYMLPSLMAAVSLADLGWRDSNLGADTPWNVIAEAARQTQPRLIWVSATTPSDKSSLMNSIEELAELAQQWHGSVAIGGQALPARVSLEPPNLHVIRSMSELIAFARGFRASTSN